MRTKAVSNLAVALCRAHSGPSSARASRTRLGHGARLTCAQPHDGYDRAQTVGNLSCIALASPEERDFDTIVAHHALSFGGHAHEA